MTSSYIKLLNPLDKAKEQVLVRVAEVANELGVPLMLTGAFARDVLFWHMHAIEPGRRTQDVDISIQLSSWADYDSFGSRLREKGFSNPNPDHPEKFRCGISRQELDLLPFGGVSEDGKSITWREDKSSWSIVGMNDALEHALQFQIRNENPLALPLISIPSLVVLKVVATHDRPEDRYKKDGTDIAFVVTRYLQAGNRERLKSAPHDDVMGRVDGDLDQAGALLLGRDIRNTCSTATRACLVRLLKEETGRGGHRYLVRGMMPAFKGNFSRARTMLAKIAEGVNGV